MVPLQDEFGWSRGLLSVAVGINLILYGLTAPFAAALMDRFGIRTITCGALVLVALGSGLTVFVTAGWQLVLTWGVLIGLGTGSMALVFAATIANRWFVKRRGLVMGVLTAAGATGQLVFLPLMAVAGRAVRLAVGVPGGLRRRVGGGAAGADLRPELPGRSRGAPYGARMTAVGRHPRPGRATQDRQRRGHAGQSPAATTANSGRHRPDRCRSPHHRHPVHGGQDADVLGAWSAGFAICGATTNGLIGTHFVPAAHDHGMPLTTAGGLLALVGIFDVVGTIASGALTDRVNPRILLAIYYAFRGVGLLMLPSLLSDSVHVSMLAFVIVYGLDWVATVPPTAALCREAFGEAGTIVFGWVFAAHQLGRRARVGRRPATSGT